MTRTPSIPNLVMKHRNHGGTGVANFLPAMMPVFRAALEATGREDLVLCSVGFASKSHPALRRGMCSLHIIDRGTDLSDFWAIFDRVRHCEMEVAA